MTVFVQFLINEFGLFTTKMIFQNFGLGVVHSVVFLQSSLDRYLLVWLRLTSLFIQHYNGSHSHLGALNRIHHEINIQTLPILRAIHTRANAHVLLATEGCDRRFIARPWNSNRVVTFSQNRFLTRHKLCAQLSLANERPHLDHNKLHTLVLLCRIAPSTPFTQRKAFGTVPNIICCNCQ